jgi:ubiquinone/menaquinone biosynthesis C-methylase UbiE
MPVFIRLEDMSGDNGKYNRLYQVINGLYDDIQRVWAALRGFDRDAFVMGFMGKLAVKPGDLVLETSVGTGLNFKKLPPGVRLSGLDLSTAMLAICQDNLLRWRIEADLYVGNAENLPFAEDSFDVVFHVGGINFFNDRAKAIGEMVRVAKPGSLLMIADETEKHVKGVYEMVPGNLYRNRETAVSAPIDLVPAGMQDLALSLLRDDEFYVITFRKPQS